MKTTTEILIIGGGLAGLVSAIELATAGHRVLLAEKKDYPRHKVCGEYVSNEVRPYLERLGAFPEELGPKEIKRFRLSSVSGSVAECEMEMGGFGISRYAFDHFLYQKAKERGVAFLVNTTVREVSFETDQFRIKLSGGQELSAKVVIGAFGKRSLIDKTLDRDFINEKSSYVGIKHHFKADFPDDLVSLHNFEGGYCGLSRVENDHVNLCYLTTTEVFKRYGSIAEMEGRHLAQNPKLRNFFGNAAPVFEKPLVISQVSFAPKQAVENHVLMTGDAAGLIHPLCGNGMAMAIHSAKICAGEVKRFLNGAASRAEMESSYTSNWKRTFSRRLSFGKKVQKLFGKNFISEMAVGAGRRSPRLMKKAVGFSHGDYVG